MSSHLTPVRVCERLIGPLPVLESIAGYRPKSGYAWLRGAIDREPGYFPSVSLMQRMLTYARAHGIPLTEQHMIWGAEAAEIEALAPPEHTTEDRENPAPQEAAA